MVLDSDTHNWLTSLTLIEQILLINIVLFSCNVKWLVMYLIRNDITV